MNDATVILVVCAVVGYVYWTGGAALSNWSLAVSSLLPAAAANAPAPLQQSPSVSRNFASVVGQAKTQLQSQGVDLSGPCGAEAVTRLSARMIGGDCGMLDKPSGNQCNGVAVDIHAYRDGFHYDVLGDGGGSNDPQYSLVGPYDVSRWRAP